MPHESHLQVYFRSKVPSNVLHMVRREIELHYALTHRNIIMLYGAFQDDKHIVLVQVGPRMGLALTGHAPVGEALPACVRVQGLLKRTGSTSLLALRVVPWLGRFAAAIVVTAAPWHTLHPVHPLSPVHTHVRPTCMALPPSLAGVCCAGRPVRHPLRHGPPPHGDTGRRRPSAYWRLDRTCLP